MKKTVDLKDLYLEGELGKRASMNQERFAKEDFEPYSEKTFRAAAYEWPGDNEGRLILAHVMLEEVTHKKSRYLEQIMKILPAYLNKQGYFGPILEEERISEQQAAGNSWILRGLLEYDKIKGTKESRQWIQSIIQGYLYPLAEAIDTYPFGEAVSEYHGEAEGCLIPQPFGQWYMSTDFGCLFILLDGATKAYERYPDKKLAGLIEAMIVLFETIDLEKLSFQTHATLSCARGIMQYYEITKNTAYLELAIKYYTLYKNKGMTATYANYNWFGKPEFTEPCAVIDSFLLALELFKATDEQVYLNDAHFILYNGVYPGQRRNGGFGCDTCAGIDEDWIQADIQNFEAWWCCSKRGAEFFKAASEHLYLIEQNCVSLPIYESSTAVLSLGQETVVVKQTSAFETEGYVRLEILAATAEQEIELSFFIPAYVDVDQVSLQLNGNVEKFTMIHGFAKLPCILSQGVSIELFIPQQLHTYKATGAHTKKDRFLLMHGPLVLCSQVEQPQKTEGNKKFIDMQALIPQGDGSYEEADSGQFFYPLKDRTIFPDSKMVKIKERVLYGGMTW